LTVLNVQTEHRSKQLYYAIISPALAEYIVERLAYHLVFVLRPNWQQPHQFGCVPLSVSTSIAR